MSAHGTLQASRSPEQISSFADDLFRHLPRADQRRWALTYLQGLLSAPGRKSVRRLALPESAAQSLQQFINASPWEWDPVLAELARWTEQRAKVKAWTVGLSVQPKRGQHSVGVHRRFLPESGRTVNCQAGVGLFLATERSAVPVDWRLHLPEQWSGDLHLRRRARIPDSVGHRPLGSHILEMADALAARTSSAVPPLVADARDYPQLSTLIHELGRRQQEFVFEVPDSLPLLPCAQDGRQHRTEPLAVSARHFRGLDRSLAVHTTVNASGALPRLVDMRSGLVRLAGPSPSGRSARPALRLFTGATEAGRPARLWISNALRRRPDELLGLTALPALADETLRSLRDIGLLNFEGRSFPGWHHHMTLVSAACAYSRLAHEEQRITEAMAGTRSA
ncbi:IS701 family transposase [Streptomyces sp. NBC_00344]|uniref:IS701 family transposase n=1 Tax=Streptomyces sp. NBC_00344 TaxID=2975720 RepID=UPI002E1A7F95